MEKQIYPVLYRLEESHWWFRGKRAAIGTFLSKFCRGGGKILDVGCGTGINLKMLQEYGEVHGIEISEDALEFCRKRGFRNLKKGSAERLPFPDGTFDLITFFDVLYHKGIKSDDRALREAYRVLKKGGRICITDAALKGLWSRHDEFVHGRTRYTVPELREKLVNAGFDVEKISYYNFFLFPIVFVVRKVHNLAGHEPKPDLSDAPRVVNSILSSVLRLEAWLMKFINLPIGVSIICIAKKI